MFCSECTSTKTNEGYHVCTTCGLVSTADISEEPEWNDYTKSRCGPIMTDNELNNTFIQRGSKSLITLNNKVVKTDIYKLHIQNSYSSKRRSFDNVCSYIDNHDRYTSKVIVYAKYLWSEFVKTGKIIRSNNRKGFIACCVYYSCLHYKYTVDPKEICRDFEVDPKYFNKSDKLFRSINKEKINLSSINIKEKINQYITKYCSELNNDNKEKINHYDLINKCIEFYKDKELQSFYEPKNIALAVIKLNSTEIKKKDILNLGISAPTLNKICKLLLE